MFQRLSFHHAMRRIGVAPWFALGILASGILSSALHSLIDKVIWDSFGITSPVLGTLVTLLAAALLGVAVVLLVAVFSPSAENRLGTEKLAPVKRGLILLVSKPDSAMFAIAHHLSGKKLEQVWLIYSHDLEFKDYGPGTRVAAETIRQRALDMAQLQGQKLNVTLHDTGVSPSKAQDTFDTVNRIFLDRSLPVADIVADFTGGTKLMTVGLIMACLASDRDLEYVALQPTLNNMHGPFAIDYRAEAFNL